MTRKPTLKELFEAGVSIQRAAEIVDVPTHTVARVYETLFRRVMAMSGVNRTPASTGMWNRPKPSMPQFSWDKTP